MDTNGFGINESTLVVVDGIKVGVCPYVWKSKNPDKDYKYSAVIMSPSGGDKADVFINNEIAFRPETPKILRVLADQIEKFADVNTKHRAELAQKAADKKAEAEAKATKKAEDKADNDALTLDMKKSNYKTLKAALVAGKPLSAAHLKQFQGTVEYLQKHCPEFLASC